MPMRFRLSLWFAVATSALALLPMLASGQTCTHYASNAGGGSGATSASAFRIGDFLALPPAPGNVLCLTDDTYIQDGITIPSSINGGPSTPITLRAVNDGGVYVNGQYARNTLLLNGSSYIAVRGIDAGQSASEGLALYPGAHHTVVTRSCFWNAKSPAAGGYNLHTMMLWQTHDNVIEDICVFGYGRNSFNTLDDPVKNNVIRRAWFRWDGWGANLGATCPGPALQMQYFTFHSNDIYENIITIFNGVQNVENAPCNGLGGGTTTRAGILDTSVGAHYLGFVSYGYPAHNNLLGTADWVGFFNRWVPAYHADLFLDARYGLSGNPALLLSCDVDDGNQVAAGGHCEFQHADRMTAIRNAGQAASTIPGSGVTNFQECTSLGSCPDFYTGTGPGGIQGARACTQYSSGSLTSTPLWPWPMDDRVKQALTRSGIGPTLAGTAGPGYAAGTVTSEIVSRYGTPPAQCIGAGAPPPPTTTAWWHFDAGTGTTATDSLASHVITLPANVGWTTPGKVGGASLRCNANTTPALADVTITNATYTWMTWLKSDAAPTTALFHAPVANGLNDNTDSWGLWWSAQGTPDWTQSIFHRDSSGLQQTKIPVPLLANTWYHLAATYDGINLRTYLNGQPQTSIAAGAPVTPSAAFRVCGRFFPSAWSGNLDDLRLDDHAWTGAQILAEYQRTVGAKRIRHRTQPH